LDEDVQLSLSPLLRLSGHDSTHVLEANMRGAADEDVFGYAQASKAILVTADLGIADARALDVAHSGVILLRFPEELSTDSINSEIMRLIDDAPLNEMATTLLVLEPGRMRIRRSSA